VHITSAMSYSREAIRTKSVSDLERLTGYWRGRTKDGMVEEYWLPEVRGNKACVFRWIRGGDIYIYEIAAVVERGGELHMLLRHFDRELTAWEEKDKPRDLVITELTPTKIVFVNTEDPDGRYMQYDTSEPNTLRFSDHEPDGSLSFELVFQRLA
jgi:hypothetical protein